MHMHTHACIILSLQLGAITHPILTYALACRHAYLPAGAFVGDRPRGLLGSPGRVSTPA